MRAYHIPRVSKNLIPARAGKGGKMTNEKKLDKLINDQNNYYSVMIDGNQHWRTGKQTLSIKTKKGLVTVKKCREIIKTCEKKFDIEIKKIEIDMSEFDYSEITADDIPYLESGDIGVPQVRRKKAYFWVKSNCLQIWEDGLPIYENNNGLICKDRDTLADCLC